MRAAGSGPVSAWWGRARLLSRLASPAVLCAVTLATGGVLSSSLPASASDGGSEQAADATSTPKAVGAHYAVAGQTDLFTIGSGGALQVRWANGNRPWKGPKQLDTNADATAGIATSLHYGTKAQTDVFYASGSGHLRAAYNFGSGWKTATISTAPVAEHSRIAVSEHYGRQAQTDVFFQGTDGALHAAYDSGTGWKTARISPTGLLGSGSDITASTNYSTKHPQTDVFYADRDGNLAATYHNGTRWKSKQRIGGVHDIAASGITISRHYGRTSWETDVFYADRRGRIHVMWFPHHGNGWRSGAIPGTAAGGSQIVATSHVLTAQTDVFYAGSDHKLHATYSYNGGAWKQLAIPHSATNLDGSSGLTAGRHLGVDTGQLDAFYSDQNDTLHAAFINRSSRGWQNHTFG